MAAIDAYPAAVPTVAVTRAQVLAHRVRQHGFARTSTRAEDLAIAALGVQDTGPGGALAALAARLPEPPARVPSTWTRVWSVRGAPHWHASADLPGLAGRLWPADDADAAARLQGTGTILRKAGVAPLEALRVTAEAIRGLVGGPRTKGEVSAAVTAAIPASCSSFCRRCRATHLQDNLLRLAALPAGVGLQADTSPPVLAPIEAWPGVPSTQVSAGTLVHDYLRVHGPAAPGAVATYLQTSQRAVRAIWPDGLVEVLVEGKRSWLPEEHVEALVAAPAPELVRLLPSCDPWLLARDRDLTVPDRARQKVLWPVLGWPGGVLVDGEVLGAWRSTAAAAHLEVTITAFGALTSTVVAQLEEEAARVAQLRGLPAARLRVDGP